MIYRYLLIKLHTFNFVDLSLALITVVNCFGMDSTNLHVKIEISFHSTFNSLILRIFLSVILRNFKSNIFYKFSLSLRSEDYDGEFN